MHFYQKDGLPKILNLSVRLCSIFLRMDYGQTVTKLSKAAWVIAIGLEAAVAQSSWSFIQPMWRRFMYGNSYVIRKRCCCISGALGDDSDCVDVHGTYIRKRCWRRLFSGVVAFHPKGMRSLRQRFLGTLLTAVIGYDAAAAMNRGCFERSQVRNVCVLMREAFYLVRYWLCSSTRSADEARASSPGDCGKKAGQRNRYTIEFKDLV